MADSLSGTIGPYLIEREIGRGGMGVVYLARDERLNRLVAVKALPEMLAADPDRLARFEREARTLAQLNHPNVAGIYGVEEKDGQKHLILEYVEGETLGDLLDRGSLPVDEALAIAVEIAAGVEAAHDAGVIHRDLKPDNIKLTPEGTVKVLDFGLAKTEEASGSTGTHGDSPTITARNSPTVPGVILGTAAYMSPEQARGRTVDKRSDIWSFGVILYEMLTGASPFAGESASDSIGAVLHKDVDLSRLPAGTSPIVRHVLQRCLTRNKAERYRDIGDVRIELTRTHDAVEPEVSAAPWRARGVTGLLATALVVALAALGALMLRRPDAPPLMRVTLEPPQDARILFTGDLAGPPVVSPDGSIVAFCGQRPGEPRRLWVRGLDATDPRELTGTDGALYPFWSPDGREIGFFTTSQLHKFDLGSGTVQRVCPVDQARGGAWSEDGRIVFSRSFRGPLWIVDADGGEPSPLTELDPAMHTSHRWPFVVPGTRSLLFSAVSARIEQAENNAVYIASLDGDGPPRRLLRSDYRAEYHDGLLLHVRDGVLLASRADLDRAELIGSPTVIVPDLAADLSTWHGQFSACATGVLVFNRMTDTSNAKAPSGYSWAVEGNRVSSFDYSGRVTTTYATGLPIFMMALSPDGLTLALSVVSDRGTPDIVLHPTAWVFDREDPEAREQQVSVVLAPDIKRLTFLDDAEVAPVWSPGSDEVAFRWDGDADRPRGIYRKRLGGGSEVLVRDNEGEDDWPSDWTSDGKYLLIVKGPVITSEKNDVWAVSLEDGSEFPVVETPDPDREPRVSPDGRWLVYTQRESGRNAVYVVPFPPAWPEGDGLDRKWRVSDAGGRMPRWSRDGDELFYITDAGNLAAVDVDTAADPFSFSPPRELFPTPWDTGRRYDVTPDDKQGRAQFMFLDSVESPDAPIAVILNWQSLLADEAKR